MTTATTSPLITSDIEHILKLGETEDGVLPFSLSHKLRWPHHYDTSPRHQEGPQALDVPGESNK